MIKQFWQSGNAWFAVPLVAGSIAMLRFSGLLQFLELAALNQFFRWSPPEPTNSQILIVTIGESDLKQVGKWPFPDGVLAKVLLNLKAQQPRAIGLDIYRDLPVEPGHQTLVNVFKSTPNLIGIEKVVSDSYGSAIAPPPVLSKKEQVGANDIVIDADGQSRRGLLYLNPAGRKAIASLGLQLALIYLKAEGITPKPDKNSNLQLGKTVFVPFEKNDGGYVNADAGGYQIILNFRKRKGNFPTVSMTDVLENRVPKELVRDRIVLIGSVAPSLNDFFYTPYSSSISKSAGRTPGVEIQALLTSQILNAALFGHSPIKTWPDFLEYGWIFLWSGIGAILSWQLRGWNWTFVSLIVASFVLTIGAFLAFLNYWWIPVIPPLFGLVGSTLVATAYIAQIERKDRQIMMNLFERHVSPQIAEAIWRDREVLLTEGRLQGQKLTATVLFTDLKDFSTISEKLDPQALMSWLNEYMEVMSQVVLNNNGVIDKYIGDAIMAVFGVPIPSTTEAEIADRAISAVRCALEMATTLRSLNQKWLLQGQPTVAMRVGIATGTVVAGSLGCSQRSDYTTIGDTVNVAARLESYDKSIDGGICRILIDEETYRYIKKTFPAKAIGSAQLKGREQVSPIYQVFLN